MLQKLHRKKHLVYVNNNILKSTVFSLNNKWKDKGEFHLFVGKVCILCKVLVHFAHCTPG